MQPASAALGDSLAALRFPGYQSEGHPPRPSWVIYESPVGCPRHARPPLIIHSAASGGRRASTEISLNCAPSLPNLRPAQFVFFSPSGTPALRSPSTMRRYCAVKVGSSELRLAKAA
jgi:hypothetical protein